MGCVISCQALQPPSELAMLLLLESEGHMFVKQRPAATQPVLKLSQEGAYMSISWVSSLVNCSNSILSAMPNTLTAPM